MLLNIGALTNPPYWDDVIGLHTQAVWLARNNFDVAGLWFKEGVLWDGGAKIHPLGIMSQLYAVGYKFATPRAVHCFGHLVNTACLAGTMTVFLALMRRHVSPLTAVLLGCVALSEPIALGVSAGLGQEAPLALLTMVSICFFCRSRYRMAYVFAGAAYFIKETAVILLLAYLSFWLFIVLQSVLRHDGKWRRRYHHPVLLSMMLGVAAILMNLFPNGAVLLVRGLPLETLAQRFGAHIAYFYPFIFIKIAIAVGALAWAVFFRQSRQRVVLALLPLIFITGFYASCFLHFVPIARYSMLILFPLSLLLGLCLRNQMALRILLPLLIVLQLYCSGGKGYPVLPEDTARTGADLERSREFLIDIESNRKLCRFLEENHFNDPIVVKWPLVHMLSMPEFGYVTKKLPEVYCVGMQPRACEVKSAKDGIRNPDKAVFIYVPHCYRFAPDLRPSPEDRIIYSDSTLPGTILLYRKRL